MTSFSGVLPCYVALCCLWLRGGSGKDTGSPRTISVWNRERLQIFLWAHNIRDPANRLQIHIHLFSSNCFSFEPKKHCLVIYNLIESSIYRYLHFCDKNKVNLRHEFGHWYSVLIPLSYFTFTPVGCPVQIHNFTIDRFTASTSTDLWFPTSVSSWILPEKEQNQSICIVGLLKSSCAITVSVARGS